MFHFYTIVNDSAQAISGTADRSSASDSAGKDCSVWRLSFLQHIHATNQSRYSLVLAGGDHGFGGISGLSSSQFLQYRIDPLHAELVHMFASAFFDAHLREISATLQYLRSQQPAQCCLSAAVYNYFEYEKTQ